VNALGSTARSALYLLLAAVVAAALTAWIGPDGRSAGKDGFYGMVVGPDVDAQRAIPKLSALGVNTVRLRMDVRDWGRPEANTGTAAYDGALRQAPLLEKEGFRVVLQVNSEGGQMPSYARARLLLEWLFDRQGASSIDVIEMLGPVTDKTANADAFSTTLTFAQQARRYVDGPLKAAWDVAHDHRKKVLGAAFTPWQQAAEMRNAGAWGLPVTRAYVAAGYLDRVDYAGFHPDQPTARAQRVWVDRARAVLTGKPLWVSEWQLTYEAFRNDGTYLDAMGDAASQLHSRVGTACYAGFTPEDGPVPVTQSGLGGYREKDPAFKVYRSWARSG
jgi:hypothetical protein